MSTRIAVTGALLILVNLAAFAQFTVADAGEDGPQFNLTGSLTGMFSAGFMDEEKQFVNKSGENGKPAPGVLYSADEYDPNPGKNGYSVSMNFSMLFSPVSYADLFIKFLAQYRPGSPYLPLQLENSDAKTFSNFSVDAAWGRVNAIKGLGFDLPLDLWIKAGKYEVLPAQFQSVSRYGAEAVLTSLRSSNTYNMQLEAAYALAMAKSLSLGFNTHLKLNEGLPVLLDEDEAIAYHGDPKVGSADIPLYISAKLNELSLPIGTLSAELIYAYNALGIYSGNNFGVDLGAALSFMDGLTIPVGIGFAMYGKNIDPFANTSIADRSNFDSLYRGNGYNNDQIINISWDGTTVSFRELMRIGFGVGARYANEDIAAELNLGFAFSQIAHYYRQTLAIPSLSVDARAAFRDNYFLGGGIFLGTLANAEWVSKIDVDPDIDDFSHTFKPADNLGFEIYGGIRMGSARFVLGYNINKGLSMNNSIESIADGQIKYRQKDSESADGLFERGGLFTKLAISW